MVARPTRHSAKKASYPRGSSTEARPGNGLTGGTREEWSAETESSGPGTPGLGGERIDCQTTQNNARWLMPRYMVERTFPDGLAIPSNQQGRDTTAKVAAKNAE